mgnify:CR=1 FL=1
MLTSVSNEFVNQYVQQASPARREDLLKIIEMMRSMAPEAELVNDLGIPYFKMNAGWLYGVAARVYTLFGVVCQRLNLVMIVLLFIV